MSSAALVPIVFMGVMGMDSHNREEARMIHCLAGLGHPVLYLAPLGVRDARPVDFFAGLRRLRRASQMPRRSTRLRSTSLLVLPWREAPLMGWVNRLMVRWRLARSLRGLGGRRPVYWLRLPTPELVEQIDALRARAVVYEVMDEYSAYPQYRADELPRLERYERRLVSQADLVVTLTDIIAERFPEAADRLQVVPLGVDLEHFGRTPGPVPADLDRAPRPRLGVVSGLDGRLDYELLDYLAVSEPTWSIVLIGPAADGLDVGPLAERPNTFLMGPRPYEQVLDYLAGLDVGLIPYRRSAWTDAIFPTKLHEYLAAGLPVVATDLPALAAYSNVIEVASSREAFLDACRRAVADHDTQRATERRALAAEHSLEARCRKLSNVLLSL